MKSYLRIAAFVTVVGAILVAVRAWMRERQRHEVFPAADASALLNPLRRFIQSPEGTVRAFGLRPGDRVLEIGPGPGYFTPHAVDAVLPAGRVVCLDVQREMLELLRGNLGERLDHVDFVVASAEQLPLRNGSFDAAFMISVLGEVPQPDRAVGELARILGPGGCASFSETFNDPDYVRVPVLRGMCEDAGMEEVAWRRQLLGYIARFRAM
jgi:ubiquinone/menaquinone biosynthesis C-methylase UbiE